MFFVIEQRPKSERRGLPFASMRMFGWQGGMLAEEKGRIDLTYTFQISMDNLVVMQVAKTAANPDQLQSSERRIRLLMR
jgi:hypothetical protein